MVTRNPQKAAGEPGMGEGDELGAHVSAAGGAPTAPARAEAIGARVLQLFTKQPNRWAEPVLPPAVGEAFASEREAHGIRTVVSHDSYLINLASPNPSLWKRSVASFEAELRRCAVLGVDLLVTHPGNATDGDAEEGIVRNARGVAACLRAVPEGPRVLLEITCGSGTSVGGSFEDLALIREALPSDVRDRTGVCFDTCHAWAAGYDLVEDYDGVWDAFGRVLGMETLGLFHLNDSRHPRGSRKDRHAGIGEGTLGPEPFRRIMTDPRFRGIPKVLETPKGDDGVTEDLRNLALLRSFRTE